MLAHLFSLIQINLRGSRLIKLAAMLVALVCELVYLAFFLLFCHCSTSRDIRLGKPAENVFCIFYKLYFSTL